MSVSSLFGKWSGKVIQEVKEEIKDKLIKSYIVDSLSQLINFVNFCEIYVLEIFCMKDQRIGLFIC